MFHVRVRARCGKEQLLLGEPPLRVSSKIQSVVGGARSIKTGKSGKSAKKACGGQSFLKSLIVFSTTLLVSHSSTFDYKEGNKLTSSEPETHKGRGAWPLTEGEGRLQVIDNVMGSFEEAVGIGWSRGAFSDAGFPFWRRGSFGYSRMLDTGVCWMKGIQEMRKFYLVNGNRESCVGVKVSGEMMWGRGMKSRPPDSLGS